MSARTSEVRPVVGEDDIARFWREGFLTVRDVLEPEDLAEVKARIDVLLDKLDELPVGLAKDLGPYDENATSTRTLEVARTVELDPGLARTRAFRVCRQVSTELLGRPAHYGFDHAIYKPPFNQTATNWHQDLAYMPDEAVAPRHVHIWLPLQTATVENGCMQFVPLSGNTLLPHHPLNGDARSTVLETESFDRDQIVPCPVEAGGLTLHTPGTLHYTGPNDTADWRRAWILQFRPGPKAAIKAWGSVTPVLQPLIRRLEHRTSAASSAPRPNLED